MQKLCNVIMKHTHLSLAISRWCTSWAWNPM